MFKKGFTLVELLAVIVILGIIIAIAVPNIQGALKSSKDKLYDVTVKKIISAAKDYVSQYEDEITGLDGGEGTITIGDMLDKGILESSVKNPKTGDPFDEDTTIRVTKLSNNRYQFELLTS